MARKLYWNNAITVFSFLAIIAWMQHWHKYVARSRDMRESVITTTGGFSVIQASNERSPKVFRNYDHRWLFSNSGFKWAHSESFPDLQVRLLRKSKPVRGYLRLGLAAETKQLLLKPDRLLGGLRSRLGSCDGGGWWRAEDEGEGSGAPPGIAQQPLWAPFVPGWKALRRAFVNHGVKTPCKYPRFINMTWSSGAKCKEAYLQAWGAVSFRGGTRGGRKTES